ncbi:MAG: DegV family protein [Acutalibacteraceae bacterium]|jgi:DegV family protein with EDD domain
MAKPVVLSADSTCDLGDELRERYHVQYYPFHVILDGKAYRDGVDLMPDDIYRIYDEKGILPKTAAINVAEYEDFFRGFTEQGYEVVHVTLGSGLSSSCNNCRLAAENVGGVYVVDSCSLSTGSGLLVIEAAERIAGGMPAEQVAAEVQALTGKSHASFVIDTLEYLYKGGRCSALARFGANLLSLKPGIEVNNADGTMTVGKKYRSSLDKALAQYVQDKLEGRTDLKRDRVFITHSGISDERVDMVRELIKKYADFDEIFVTRAGCTITSHCGPNTLGVLFMTV